MTLLHIDKLRVALDDTVLLDALSLSVAPGEIVGLVGESGSGKSLTALAIMGLLAPEITASGSILLDGRQIVGASERDMLAVRGQIAGIVFQEPMTALNPVMRAGDQVAETLLCHGIARAEAKRRAEEALDQVGLPGAYDRYPHQLSGGQRQRVAIAIAIALRPRLLIADEPTTALDATTQAQIVVLLRKLVAETGMGLLLISHDLTLVARIANRTITLRQSETPPAVPPRQPGKIGDVLLQGSGLVRDYRHPKLRVLDGVDIAVHEGESVAIIGESGSGKSTLLRTLLGLEAPQSGSITLAGRAIDRAGRKRIQAVFQDPASSFDPRWKVEKLVAEPLSLLDTPLPAAERRRRVEEALLQVGLPADAADRFPHQFSGGQRQRIAIARALVVEPDLIVFDEATSALDPSVKTQILALLAGIAARRRIAYLFVTHDLASVKLIADRVLEMRGGKLVQA
jgi:peptide/nickel transport system ATP-binding protein